MIELVDRGRPDPPEVSVIIPARNERDSLLELIPRLCCQLEASGLGWEVVLVDDCSEDGTSELADRMSGGDSRIESVHRVGRPGFGLAIKEGMRAAHGTYLIPFMADLSDSPSDLVSLVAKAKEGYDVVYGSRFVPGGAAVDYPRKKLLANRAYNVLVSSVFGLARRDITNAFKCYHRSVLNAIRIDDIESTGFEITVEMPIKAHLLGFSSVEVPVTWRCREKGKAKMHLASSGPSYGRRLLSLVRGH